MKFEIKDLEEGGYKLYEKSSYGLIWLGDIYLGKEYKKNKSFSDQHENWFDYHEIQNALCGKEPNKFGLMYFTPKRILVIQMK